MREGLSARLGALSQPAIVQVYRVSAPRGASPPGRTPRRTRIVGPSPRVAIAVLVGPESVAMPAVGKAEADDGGPRCGLHERFRLRRDEHAARR